MFSNFHPSVQEMKIQSTQVVSCVIPVVQLSLSRDVIECKLLEPQSSDACSIMLKAKMYL